MNIEDIEKIECDENLCPIEPKYRRIFNKIIYEHEYHYPNTVEELFNNSLTIKYNIKTNNENRINEILDILYLMFHNKIFQFKVFEDRKNEKDIFNSLINYYKDNYLYNDATLYNPNKPAGHNMLSGENYSKAIYEIKEIKQNKAESRDLYVNFISKNVSKDKIEQDKIKTLCYQIRCIKDTLSTQNDIIKLINTPYKDCFIIPDKIILDEKFGFYIKKAKVIAIKNNGSLCYFEKTLNLEDQQWNEEKKCFSINMDNKKIKELSLEKIENYSISVLKSQNFLYADVKSTLKKTTKNMLKKLQKYLNNETLQYKNCISLYMYIKNNKIENYAFPLIKILDKNIRKICLTDPTRLIKFYIWASNENEEIQKKRLQAIQSFPLLSNLLPEMSETIDSGKELYPVIFEKFGLNPAIIKKMNKLSLNHVKKYINDFSFKENSNFSTRLYFLQKINPNLYNKYKFDFILEREKELTLSSKMFYIDQSTLENFLYHYEEPFEKNNKKLINTNDFMRFFSNIIKEIDNFINKDSNKELIADNIIPIILSEYLTNKTFNFNMLNNISEKWHKHHFLINEHINAIRNQNNNIISWKPLSDNFVNENGSLTWITNYNSLLNEGIKMQHCVLSYLDNCVNKYSHIAHIIDNENNESTVEIITEKDKIKIVQNNSFANHSPSKKCIQIADDFVMQVNNKSISIDYKDFIPTNNYKNNRKLGFSNLKQIETIFEIFKLFLPKNKYIDIEKFNNLFSNIDKNHYSSLICNFDNNNEIKIA